MTGHRCFGEFAVQASKLEMEFFKKMGVHKKVPRNLAKKMGLQGHHHKRCEHEQG